MARALARAFAAPLVYSTVSRLVVDLNRSIGHPRLFSPATRSAAAETRARVVERHYLPYRTEVALIVGRSVARGRRVIHVSSHSFTPVLDGKVRRADVGLLYDPARDGEALLCARWKAALGGIAPELRVRRNYPYAGKGDGLTSYLRRHFPPAVYVGIELEVNQKIVLSGDRRWTVLRRVLVASLRAAAGAQ
jgi:predicted N-formylglutamate amidohydrolase